MSMRYILYSFCKRHRGCTYRESTNEQQDWADIYLESISDEE